MGISIEEYDNARRIVDEYEAQELDEHELVEPRYWPKINPWMIELAMNYRGGTPRLLAKASGIPYAKVIKYINGTEEPTEEHIKLMIESLDFPLGHFEDYPKTRISWPGYGLAKNLRIDYYGLYPIMRGGDGKSKVIAL